MDRETRFSVGRGMQGCLVSWLCMLVIMLPISLILVEWLELISVETERIIRLFVWLLALGVGGYFAARWDRRAGWTNALVVGVLAEAYLVARLLKGTSFLEMMDEPGLHWRRLVALALTIPAAVVGGMIWERMVPGGAAAANHESMPVDKIEPRD